MKIVLKNRAAPKEKSKKASATTDTLRLTETYRDLLSLI